ncbi:energy-coupling factor transport system substrate-specific component [Anaerobacterium chartisolvens]|uniref:Energy-coupling factor transport system substrate-specific component n=1 Tax=Anaerobacterium chartisolvens TaxID=1297424 RepID=A0A369BCY9_9FIRM|nr:MptD family putative ECF transporter S component [Anaerobacterium chartisolvens]RCX19403.1 energy-coupling factor transport system substrate-specific component [Anaerobacterium chartisolvens]
MNNKLQTKDLISVGIFTAIYFVIFFACGMLGYIPILFILLPAYMPMITGIPFMLFLTKVKKFGMVSIMAILLGIIMFATGHTWVPIATALIFGLLADLVFKTGKYQSFKHSVLGYGIFSMWSMGAMLPLWIMRDSYLQYISNSMGDEYTNAVISITPDWAAVAIFFTAFASGIAGAFLGKAVLKKHFQRAGIA